MGIKNYKIAIFIHFSLHHISFRLTSLKTRNFRKHRRQIWHLSRRYFLHNYYIYAWQYFNLLEFTKQATILT